MGGMKTIMMALLVFLSTATAEDGDCGREKKQYTRIVGGDNSKECQFPWAVSLSIGHLNCAGSIIDRYHILTAAHCARSHQGEGFVGPSSVTVKVGSSNVDKMQTLQVQYVFGHEGHVVGINNYDVAILKLTEPLVYSECVAPICLPEPGTSPNTTKPCMAIGWGKTGEKGSKPHIMKKVELPLVGYDQCLQAYGPEYINDLKLCAGNFEDGGVDTCQGDSGGPLMCLDGNQWVQYGITSFGTGCALPGNPGVYTNVANPEIMEWIMEVLSI